ncbi:hypothetical protein [Streptomyces lavendulocolor]|jgi:hypothetical protein|uniref:hypothetical protein n=1 Tax=Streptomyces lavendulocolor TaxID=67316 RepID=UPI003C2C7C6A
MEFLDSYSLWRQLVRPPKGVDEATRELRTDLLVSDEYLLSVANLVEYGTFAPPKVDVFAYLDELLLRAERLMSEGDPEVRESARGLHAYAALSRQVYEQYLDAGSQRG